jgi:hypothetical protein
MILRIRPAKKPGRLNRRPTMTTIYLGGSFISYQDPRYSHLSNQAREAAYFEQFKPENLCEIRAVPVLTILATVLIAFLALGSFLSDDAIESGPDAGPRAAADLQSSQQPSVAQRFREAREIRPPLKLVERPEIPEP